MKEFKAVALMSKAQLIGQLNPKAWDALIPKHQFVFSNAHVDLLTADLVRQISVDIPDQAMSRKVFGLSQEMARSASSALVGSWEPGDEICPPWPFPGPFPHDWFRQIENTVKPQPDPWNVIVSAEMIQLAYVLTQAAGLTSDATFSRSLISVATEIVTGATRKLVDDFEKCGTKPRLKFPRKTPVTRAETAHADAM